MTSPLVAIDADVLGRRRTGDETYVSSLLAELGRDSGGLRIVALTRRPDLVPEGVEPYELTARSQELRMALTLPRALRRLRPALVHCQYALPPRLPCPAVVTVHDLSFERDPGVMGRLDRITFRWAVPRAVRRSTRVLTVSERTKRDLVELYGTPREKIVVTPNGVDGAFVPGPDGGAGGYLLFVGAVQRRKDPLAAAAAAAELGLPLVVVGPEKEPALARELRRRGVDVRGWVDGSELPGLYRRALALVFPSRFEGFGLPVVEAMASGTPVVVRDDPALREIAGDAAVYAADGELAAAIERALGDRERLVAAGLERASRYTWSACARRTIVAYREALES